MDEKKIRFLKTAAVFFMVIVVPFGSWVYLQKGLDYQKASLAELKDYGKVADFNLQAADGVTLTADSLLEKLNVVAFVNLSDKGEEAKLAMLYKLYDQFDRQNKVAFLIHDYSENALPVDRRNKIAKESGLYDPEQVYFLGDDSEQIKNLMSRNYKVPLIEEGRKEDGAYALKVANNTSIDAYPYFILVNNEGTIINYYDYKDAKAMGRLVEHIALRMPRVVEEDPKLQRSREK